MACAALLAAPATRGANAGQPAVEPQSLTGADSHADMLLREIDGALGVSAFPAARKTPLHRADRPMDVTRYDLDLVLSDVTRRVEGVVAVTLTPRAPLDSVVLDLFNLGMTVESMQVEGVLRPFAHAGDTLAVALATPIAPGDTVTVTVRYSGIPVRPEGVGFGYDVRQLTGEGGSPQTPVVGTLSEPDGARSWWPCHDTPYDAAPVRLSVTAPDHLVLGAAGRKTEDVSLPAGLRRQTWWMPSPIPAYLVSIALADYQVWTESAPVHRWPGGEATSMPVEYYAPAFLEAEARAAWQNTVEMIGTFETMFGPYPFADLKYGMALFVFGGAMEHPTLSSMGQSTIGGDGNELEWIVAHELAHQWFGDCVRLARWGEVWLNEGFASYCEVLWSEQKYGEAAGRDQLMRKRRDSYPGTLLDPPQLFGTTAYHKGTWVLHMLRQVLGRDGLVTAMRNYVTDPALRFAPVTSADFQGHCEAVYGAPLDWFFVPWLTREGRPRLTFDWTQQPGSISVTVQQPQDDAYRLPLPLRVDLVQGPALEVVRWIDGPSTTFTVAVPTAAATVTLDPRSDWLLEVQERSAAIPALQVAAPYPNPFNPTLTLSVLARDGGRLIADVLDTRGRFVRRLFDGEVIARGPQQLVWDGNDADGHAVGSGVYTVRFTAAGGHQQSVRATLVR